jgi:enoyl-CoA hydratase/carnithine racemase
MSDELGFTCKQGVAFVTLNRPRQLNALSESLLHELIRIFQIIHSDPTIRVVVLAGAGSAFCAGHDLKQMRSCSNAGSGKSKADQQAYFRALFALCAKMMQMIVSIPQPVIARVHGVATAAGCQLVAQCDLAIASSEARFAVSGINLGLFCSTPAVPLTRNVNRKKSFEMLMTGEFLNASEALKHGLVNHVVNPADLDTHIDQLCKSIQAKPFNVVALGKRLFYQQQALSLPAAYQLAGETMAWNMMLPETIDGIDAFLDKRTQ